MALLGERREGGVKFFCLWSRGTESNESGKLTPSSFTEWGTRKWIFEETFSGDMKDPFSLFSRTTRTLQESVRRGADTQVESAKTERTGSPSLPPPSSKQFSKIFPRCPKK